MALRWAFEGKALIVISFILDGAIDYVDPITG